MLQENEFDYSAKLLLWHLSLYIKMEVIECLRR